MICDEKAYFEVDRICREITKDTRKVFDYTNRGNLVGMVTNGSAVLGYGNLGPQASKPVIEVKSGLLKKLAGIDAFDIELDTTVPEEVIKTIKLLEPTFGAINLEDIKAPECFTIEKQLREIMGIPVWHDDRHGTAIVCGAALLNALILQDKELCNAKIVICGDGPSAIGCNELFVTLGADPENIYLVLDRDLVFQGLKDLECYPRNINGYRSDLSLESVIRGADVFVGISQGGILSSKMLSDMADRPIVMALAYPQLEIDPLKAHKIRKDLIMGTSSAAYPNYLNNVLAFPAIFRAALDIRATCINTAMQIAATQALAGLAMETTEGPKQFSPDYIVPAPWDPRILPHVTPAIGKAAIQTGVAGTTITDWNQYQEHLQMRTGLSQYYGVLTDSPTT